MAETELKLVIDEATAKELWRRAFAVGLATSQPRPKLLRSIYYDTADHALKNAGIALRMRRDGRRWIQTVKAKASLTGGLSRTGEWEAPAPGGRLNLALIPDEAVRSKVDALIGATPLGPVCETAIRRRAGVVSSAPGRAAELAVDVGEIIAGDRSEPHREAEIELIEGPLAGLYDVAEALFPSGGLEFSALSKAQRGYRLAAGEGIAPARAPRNAKPAPLARGMTAEEAAQAALRECLDMIAANLVVVREIDDPEGPHQLRVGLRRLRSAGQVFADAIGGPQLKGLEGGAKMLGRGVGALRDLDVAVDDVLAPEAARTPEEPGFAALIDLVEAAGAAQREALRKELHGEEVQRFLFDLARFTETRGWLAPDDMGQTARLARPVDEMGRDALDKVWKAAAKKARGLETLTIEQRHDLRKALKSLRYAVEFLSPLYPPKKVAPFLKRLKALQTIFGALNDLAMVEDLFTGEGAMGSTNPAAQRAVGRLLGASAARAEKSWEEAADLWRDLKSAKKFWK